MAPMDMVNGLMINHVSWIEQAAKKQMPRYNERTALKCAVLFQVDALRSVVLSIIAVIPARYQSSRFPGKPLALIAGKPMIQWVYERVFQAQCFDQVIVATDHPDILEAVERFGGQARMTDPNHPSGTDRVWEIANQLPQATIIFNVQGDEPLVNPLHLEEASAFLNHHHDHADIVTLKTLIRDRREWLDPNVVKVVTNPSHQALYFSRAPIPFIRDSQSEEANLMDAYRHIGIYGYTREALAAFVAHPVSRLESLEKLEQLRALELGMRLYAIPVEEAPIGVDTPEDLKHVEHLIQQQLIA